ncbi:MAG: DUF393 domain-containing protein [Candidatus Melainabacteria bacterium]|jgi:predicted DCC family thiol-disulfide oxidoreductase YuxK|nr:DUF393 domain-containing protein [Candidatus Melainabacteria bacterium]
MQKNILIYDADCGFCQNSVDKLKSIIGESVDYLPRAKLKDGDYGISSQNSIKAIQFIVFDNASKERGDFRRKSNDDYQVYSAAQAVFRAIETKFGFFLWCYKYLPGFAWVSEKIYKLIANNRKRL